MALHNYFHFLHMIKNIALNHFFTTYPFHLKTKDFKAFTPRILKETIARI